MSTEADTCWKFVLPKLYAAGWDDERICEQRAFTDGRIIVRGDIRHVACSSGDQSGHESTCSK